MSLMSKLARFAQSPQGRRAFGQAKRYATSPQGKAKIEQAPHGSSRRAASRRPR